MAKQYITYEPINWAQGVSGGTPLNASNLNRMEDAIEELVEKVNAPITSDDIGEAAVGNAQIAADSVTSDKLAQSVRDSLSRITAEPHPSYPGMNIFARNKDGSIAYRLCAIDSELSLFSAAGTKYWSK